MQLHLFELCMILLTLAVYLAMTQWYKRFPYPYFIPVLTSTALMVGILALFHIPYQSYMQGGEWISSLLGPSVVALAYPLYKQRQFLIQHLMTILGGALVGTVSGMVSVTLLGKLLGLESTFILSIIPKSLTTPVAIEVAKGLGGDASMAVVSVMIAGNFGVVLAPMVFTLVKIHSPIGRGIALGSASHALGTAKAAEYGEQTFSMSSVTMTLCAILGSFLGPIIVWLFDL